jgi:hypothetical protein
LLFTRPQKYAFSQCVDDKLYLLRCTEGQFRGRFLFINRTADGELFGSADPEEHEQVTMYIEDAGLSPFHAQITFADASGEPIFTNDDFQ